MEVNNYTNIPRDGLVAEYLLDGNANDTSGSGNNGTATNVTWVKSEKGYTKEVGSFNGSSSKVDINHILNGGSFTISCYVNFKDITTHQKIIYQSTDGGNTDEYFILRVGKNSNKVTVFLGGNEIDSNIDVETNKYYNIVVTYSNGGDFNLFIDSINNGSNAIGTEAGTINMDYFGRGGNGYENRYNGYLGLVRIYNTALSQQEIHNLNIEANRLLGNAPSYPDLFKGCVGYWDFRNNHSNLITGENATVNGATLTTDHLGNSNSAYSFNGISDYIGIADNNNFSFTNIIFSKSYWLKSTNTTTGKRNHIITKGGVSNYEWGDEFNGTDGIINTIIYRPSGAGKFSRIGLTSINDGVWHHIVTVYNNGLPNIYVDGVIDNGTGTIGVTDANVNGTNLVRIGSRDDNNDYLKGQISDVKIINIALSASEVKTLYDLTKTKYIYPFSKESTLNLQDGLVMHLNSLGQDLSGNGNNGTPTNVIPVRKNQSEGGIYDGSSSDIDWDTNSLGDNYSGNITINGWIYLNNVSVNDTRYLLILGDYGADAVYVGFHINNGYIYIKDRNGNSNNILAKSNDGVLPKEEWHMLTGILDGDTMYIYIDGQLKATGSGSNVTYSGSNWMKQSCSNLSSSSSYYLDGKRYELKIRNRALSPKEVEQEYLLSYI